MNCEICGTERLVKPSLASRFRACSNRCRGALGRMSEPRISSIERTLQAALIDDGLKPEPQFCVGPWQIDLAFPALRIAVECDGIYWHSRPAQQAKDRQKNGHLRHLGWTVLRFTDADINGRLDYCVKIVLDLVATQARAPA